MSEQQIPRLFLRDALRIETDKVIAEIQSMFGRQGFRVETDSVRNRLGRLDGLRYAENLLFDEKLLEPETDDDLRRALTVLRLAFQTASLGLRDGFAEGIDCLRPHIAKLLERS